MDIIAHSLWAGLTVAACIRYRRRAHDRRTVALAVAAGALPDLLHALPVVVWSLSGQAPPGAWLAYATAVPATEPFLPGVVALAAHHLHCVAHSAIVAGVVTALVWRRTGAFWLPLLGWWSHVLIDVLSHSADFYPSPVLYPVTLAGFDGFAWNTPWALALNYLALAGAGWWLWRGRTASH